MSLPATCGDSGSLVQLVREAAAALGGEGAAAGDEPLQYADYAEWLRELGESDNEEAGEARAFWAGFDPDAIGYPTLPFERTGEVRVRSRRSRSSGSIPGDLVDGVGRLAGELGVSVRFVGLSCWVILMARMTGRSDILTSVIADGRTQPELDNALGLFGRALPIAYQVNLDRPWSGAAARLGELVERAERFQDYAARAMGSDDGGASSGPAIEFEWTGAIPSFEAAGRGGRSRAWKVTRRPPR